MPLLHFKSITEYHNHFELPEPQNPLFSVLHTSVKEDEEENCSTSSLKEPIELSTN
ncbi:hypothetical protein [Aquimarina litoralis]|uniref:hypothetical protein n=1 Tax=Aquimarina litoralis TaxID=584605 RepID=UPI001C57D920|nr:hypothetical protein [Aquimarina litoralis]